MVVQKVKQGDLIKVEYEGKLENGTVFDASKLHDAPLQFEAGSGQMIKGFDDAVLGMKVGEEKEVTLQPAEAYGQINPSLLKKVPQSQLPLGQKIEKGMVLDIGLPTGQKIPARVVEVTLNDITIDLNHPLAGKVLKFKIKVVAIQGSTSV
ncbi:peptidylprolyl isomerase [Candidatus Woesearchaeota archaeon]|nr:peptidylprolyl isomerase [Candidatus Woesearchaeota archaeon]